MIYLNYRKSLLCNLNLTIQLFLFELNHSFIFFGFTQSVSRESGAIDLTAVINRLTSP